MSVQPLTLSEKISWSSPEANDDDDVNQLVELASSIELKEIENNKTKILETDKLDNLVCYHFYECDNNSSEEHKQLRGVIKEKETNKIICKTFGFTPEIVENDDENIQRFIVPMVEAKATCFYSYEGSLLRMFHYDGKWYLSTHRKINAFKSKWGFGKSYGDLFAEYLKRFEYFKQFTNEEVIQKFGTCFEKDQVFVFLITSYKENRIVSNKQLESPNVYIVGQFKQVENDCVFVNNFERLVFMLPNVDEQDDTSIIGMIETPEVHDITNPNINIDISEKQGLVLIDSNGNSVKLINKEYADLVALRKNNPNLVLRYIELQQENNKEKIDTYIKLYDDYSEKFKEYDVIMADIIGNIFRKYRNRFVRKLESIAPPDQYYVIRELHEKYLQDPKNIVTPVRVEQYVKSLKPDRLFGLYTQYLKRKQENGHGNKIKEDFRTKVKDIIHAQ
jgi:hypothetical protein